MARRPRQRRIDVGGSSAVKLGTPAVTADLYYSLMDIGWPAFVGLASGVFVAINLAFGLIYAALPGSIMNARAGSLADGFFFSVETLGTVGYGNMAPATPLGHSIAAIEILTGLFFSAAITGLIFARFARPRDGIIFSNVAVVGTYEAGSALMVRLASIRTRPIADAIAQIGWIQRVTLPDGRNFGRIVELPLVRSRNPMFNLSWTLVHMLDADSPVAAALASEEPLRLVVTVSGLDTLLATQTFGGKSYTREEILRGHEFIDVIADRAGTLHLDLGLLHSVQPSTIPT